MAITTSSTMYSEYCRMAMVRAGVSACTDSSVRAARKARSMFRSSFSPTAIAEMLQRRGSYDLSELHRLGGVR